jgi:capsular exopolysaccharide synthesis family protein
MESRQQLRLLWASRWWLLLAVVVAGVAAYLVASRAEEQYRADALVQVIPAPQASGVPLSTDQLLQATNFYAELAETRGIVEAASSAGDLGDITESVEVEAEPDLLVLRFSGISEDPARASEIANAYARAFIDGLTEIETTERERLLEAPQQRLEELRRQLRDLDPDSGEAQALQGELAALQQRVADEALTPTDRARVLEPALTPTDPVSPQPLRDALLAMLLALVIASAVVLLRNALTDRYGSAEEAALDLGLPVLGELPKAPATDVRALEALRKLRAQVQFSAGAMHEHGQAAGHTRPNVLLVTSPEASAGKTYVSAGLANALAADGRSVIAVDGDLRRPSLHAALDVPGAPGLGEALAAGEAGDAALAVRSVPVPDGVRRRGGGLDVLPAGNGGNETAESLSSAVMRQVVERVRDGYDAVVLDSPPVLAIVDAVVLSRYADGVLLVLDGRRSRRRSVRRSVQTLRAVEAPILGIVFNRARVHASEYGYYGTGPVPDRGVHELSPP